jgi:hypothetical protein
LNSVNIQINASFDAFTSEGRAASALALQRSVAFHDALISVVPELGRLQGPSGAEPLLRIASYQQSRTGGQTQDLVIQFDIPR